MILFSGSMSKFAGSLCLVAKWVDMLHRPGNQPIQGSPFGNPPATHAWSLSAFGFRIIYALLWSLLSLVLLVSIFWFCLVISNTTNHAIGRLYLLGQAELS